VGRPNTKQADPTLNKRRKAKHVRHWQDHWNPVLYRISTNKPLMELRERLVSERVSAALRLASEFVALSAEAMRQRQMVQLAQAV